MKELNMLALALLILVGCGHALTTRGESAPSVSVQGQLLSFRTTIRELRQSPNAKDKSIELDQSAALMSELERMQGKEDKDEMMIELKLAKLDGMLATVRAYIAKKEEEAALETVRNRYAQRLERVERLKKETGAKGRN